MFDTITKPTTIHLDEPFENLSISTDSIDGTTTYRLVLGKKGNDSQSSVIWESLFFGSLVIILVLAFWFWFRKKTPKNLSIEVKQDSETILRNEMLRLSEAYKTFVKKGYFSVNRRTSLEMVNEQEISALCESVANTFTSFSVWLREKDLSEKDFLFCCLLKSGLSTFELAEIYCVSESAIFKRKQKLKERLGFGSDARALDAIIQEL